MPKPRPVTPPKIKRRSRTHIPGGQLFEDIPRLSELIDQEATLEIARKVFARRRPTRASLTELPFSSVVHLHEELTRVVGWFRVKRHHERAATPSELVERLSAVEGAIERLWSALGIPGKATDAAKLAAHQIKPNATIHETFRPVIVAHGKEREPDRVSEMTHADMWSTDHAILEARIAEQGDFRDALVPTSHYPDVKIWEALQSLLELLAWTKAAKSQSQERRDPQPKRAPDEGLLLFTWDLSKVYRKTFDAEPTETCNGPWLTFLAQVLALAGEHHRSQESLRQLWRKTRKAAIAAPG